MSFTEGGEFHCYIHDYKADTLDKWNDHCFGNPEHTESGQTACIACGVIVEFSDLPYHKIDPTGSKNISLRCEACESKMTGKVKRGKKSQ